MTRAPAPAEDHRRGMVSETEKAGRDLDEAVARDVMGWTFWDAPNGDWNGPDDVWFFARDDAFLRVFEPGTEEPSFYWRPSEEIRDAWMIVEKISEIFDDIFVAHIKGQQYAWEVECSDKHDNPAPRQAVYICADTAPLAICRAALAIFTTTAHAAPATGGQKSR